jgi:hypothetical protein
MSTPPRAFSGLLALGLLAGCPKKQPVQQKPELDPSTLFLEPVPAATARVRFAGPGYDYVGPSRFERERVDDHWVYVFEDFERGQPIEVCIAKTEPTSFCPAPEAMEDSGSLKADGDTEELRLERKGYDEQTRSLQAWIDLSPEATPPADDWIQTGTVLHFGRAFDDKPVTKTVPMALNVRVGATNDGGRVLTWTADIDVRDQTEITGDRTMEGRRLLSGEAVASSTQHSDAFTRGEDVSEDATSIFVSKKAVADAIKYGGAPFHDLELGAEGVLVVTGRTTVTVPADGGLWEIPALVATVGGGKAVYVIADDPDHPLILSATRPGYRIRLMAVSSPGDG